MINQRKLIAYRMGQRAFEKGIRCASCLDKDFMTEFVAKAEYVGASVPYMKAWIAGWTDANLDAPVQEIAKAAR